MRMKVRQPSGGVGLTVGSQGEFLKLYRSGVIVDADLVLRGDRWLPVGELPWVRGQHAERRTDNRRLLWLTVALMALGLIGVLWIQSRYPAAPRRISVHAVPH